MKLGCVVGLYTAMIHEDPYHIALTETCRSTVLTLKANGVQAITRHHFMARVTFPPGPHDYYDRMRRFDLVIEQEEFRGFIL